MAATATDNGTLPASTRTCTCQHTTRPQNWTGRPEDPYVTEEVGIQKHDKLNDGQTQGWNYNKVKRSAT